MTKICIVSSSEALELMLEILPERRMALMWEVEVVLWRGVGVCLDVGAVADGRRVR